MSVALASRVTTGQLPGNITHLSSAMPAAVGYQPHMKTLVASDQNLGVNAQLNGQDITVQTPESHAIQSVMVPHNANQHLLNQQLQGMAQAGLLSQPDAQHVMHAANQNIAHNAPAQDITVHTPHAHAIQSVEVPHNANPQLLSQQLHGMVQAGIMPEQDAQHVMHAANQNHQNHMQTAQHQQHHGHFTQKVANEQAAQPGQQIG